MKTFADRLTLLREDSILYQKALAKALNVTTGTISNYENDVHSPDLETLVKIADYFDVSADYLLGRTSSKLSVNCFSEQYTRNTTIDDLIRMAKQLPPETREALIQILITMH